MTASDRILVAGGGLAGCEAAWQAAQHGIPVDLFEMRPRFNTPAHATDRLAELVCSNSLGSDDPDRAGGLLKAELTRLGSLLIDCARAARVPAGQALAVDRERFSSLVEAAIISHPLIRLHRRRLDELPLPAGQVVADSLTERPAAVIIATGPLTGAPLADHIRELLGQEHLSFYDAVAPIVSADSLDSSIIYRGSRYGRGEAGYLNCPMSAAEYHAFLDALVSAQLAPLHDFESPRFFESCLPIEEMARRGRDTLRFGPLKAVGLPDPRTGRLPYAVVQLRCENREESCHNLVGFQTRLLLAEQRRVFRMIPGLAQAEFLRYGVMHRNLFINAPLCLEGAIKLKGREGIYFAGQLTGVEGYTESVASGLLAGRAAARALAGLPPLSWPAETMIGALIRHLSTASPEHFQPMNANFGLLPPLAERVKDRQRRNHLLSERARAALDEVLAGEGAEYTGREPVSGSPGRWAAHPVGERHGREPVSGSPGRWAT